MYTRYDALMKMDPKEVAGVLTALFMSFAKAVGFDMDEIDFDESFDSFYAYLNEEMVEFNKELN